MTTLEQIRDDLAYVQGVVQAPPMPVEVAAIYWLWAAITLLGFMLPDFLPRLATPYWLAALPLGVLLSAALGWRAQRRLGLRHRAAEWRVLGHWCVTAGAALVASAPLNLAGLQGEPVPAVAGVWIQAPLLAVAVGYALAGVHLHRPLLLVGLLMAGCYFVAATRPELPYLSSFIGLALAVGLGLTAYFTPAPARA